MAAVVPAADQATDLLQKLSLDSKSEAGEDKQAKEKVSAALNGALNGVVANPNPGAYGEMYCYPQYGVAVPGHDGQIYGSHHYQYPSMYNQSQPTANRLPYKCKIGKSAPSPQEEVSTAAAADQQPVLVDASKASSPIGPPSPGFMSSIYSSSGMYTANAYGTGFWSTPADSLLV